MINPHSLLAVSAMLLAPLSLFPQSTLKDGTALSWNHEITVGHDSITLGTISLPAFVVPVYEAKPAQVWSLLKTELPGSNFRKAGRVMRSEGVSLEGSPALTAIARVDQDRRNKVSTLVLAFMDPAVGEPVDEASLEPSMRSLAVTLNKGIVQQQIKDWEKKLGKAGSKTARSAKSQDKVQSRVDKSRNQLRKAAKEKSKLQREHSLLQKQIDLENEKWRLSQHPKDLKRLTRSRSRITKNESKMAKVMEREAKAQRALSKSTSNLPDAQKAKEEKAAQQSEVQRTVDALHRKLESIR